MGKLQKRKLYLLIASLQAVMIAFLVLLAGPSPLVNAAVGTNPQLSFEGKIVHSDGTNITNGTYNMEFKIYQDGTNTGSGSTLKWTEDYLVTGSTGMPSTGGVTLTDGTFQVNLASICAFTGGTCGAKTNSGVNWNQDTLWLSVQIGNTSSCTVTSSTTSFNTGCAGDGEMNPYIRLTSVPYANNSAALSGLVAGNFVQLAQGLQADGSTTNASIAINKTGSTANILTLQKSGNSVMLIDNNGLVTLQPAANLTAGQTALSQTLTNASSTGGTVQGLSQTITISNTSSASTTNGVSISVNDTSGVFGNANNGLNISVGGNGTATNKGINISVTAAGIGVDSTITNGTGLRGTSSSSGPAYCGINTGFNYSIGVCGDASGSGSVGVYGHTTADGTTLIGSDGAAGIYGNSNGSIASGKYSNGVFGQTANTNTGTYTTIAIHGEAKGGTNSTAYGGYFTYNSASAAVLGSALYASNSSVAANILQLQDNTTDVMTVGDSGLTTFKNSTNSLNAFQIQTSGSTSPLFDADTINSRLGVNVTYTAMTTPTQNATATSTSGGSLAAATYFYKITAIDSAGGETLPSTERSQATTGAASTVTLSWVPVTGASGYKIYRSTATNTEVYLTTTLGTVNSSNRNFIDTGSIAVGTATVPTATTAYVSTNSSNATLQLSVGGNGAPTGQLYVSGITPTFVGRNSDSSLNHPRSVFIQGRYAYVVSATSNKLVIYDISNPAIPTFVGTNADANLNGPYGIYVQGRYAYVTSPGTGKLAVYDISNPASPTFVGTNADSVLNGPQNIVVSGRYAYIANTSGNKLAVYDISNPASPTFVAVNADANLSAPYAVFIQGRYAYLTGNNKLAVYDISNPASPTFVALNSDSNLNVPQGIYVQGRYAYIANNGANNMAVYDISNPASPTFSSTSDNANMSGPTSVSVQGRYAYLASNGNNKLAVYDVSNPISPTFVALNSDSNLSAPTSIFAYGRYAYVTSFSNSKLAAYDLGGAYIQQLEAGGAEFGTLAVDSNFQAAGDAAVAGGLSVGQGLNVGGGFNVQAGNSSLLSADSTSKRIGVNVTYAPMNLPTSPTATTPAQNATPTVTPTGGTGSTTYNYIIIAVKATGNSAASVAGTTSTGVTTLSTTTYNALAWTAFSGATSYNVYRTSGGTTTGFIGNVSTNSFSDTGIPATGSVPTAGGSLTPSSTYMYKVSAIDNVGGETALSSEVSSATGASGTLTIDFSWTAPSPSNGIAGYRVYRTAAGGATGTEKFLTTVLGTSFTDDGTITLSATTPPISTTVAYTPTNNSNTLLQLSIGGNGAPTGQLYVGGVLSSSPVSTVSTGVFTTAVAVQGKYVYTAGSGAPGAIIDVSNPASPVKVGSFSGLSGSVNDIAVQGPTLYVAGLSLQVYNVNSPSSTTLLSTTGVGNSADAIDVQGRYAYVVTEGSSTVASLKVFDMTNPSSPVSLGATPVGNAAGGGSATKIKVSGRYAYVSAWASGKFLIVDISNPRAPTVVSALALSTPSDITLLGKYAYILSSNNNKLYVVDISAPSSPVLVTSLSTAIGTPNAMALQGRYAYITGSSGLQIMDVSNPSSPVSVGTTTATAGTDIAINGRYAYLTSSSTLQILDLGGGYIQQLEAGGAEFGTLSVNGNSSITGTQAISGGLNVGSGIQTSGDLGVTGGALIQGSTILTGGSNTLSVPTAPSVTSQGANVDTATWTYVITAVNAYGGETTASSGGSVTAADNATLTAANNNLISWSAVSGATSYNVYRTAHGTSPSSNGFIGSTTSLSFTDSGLAGSNTAPTINTTGQLTVVGSALFKNSVNSATAFEIQNSTGTSVLKADTTSNTVTVANLTVSGTCTGCGATSLNAAYNTAATTGNAIGLTSSGAGVLIKDNATPIGGDLFAVQKSTGSVDYLGVTATGINIQSNFTGSAVNALALDTSTAIPHLKIFGANGTSYSDIYYDSSTSTAYYGASTGTAVLGSGTGPVNVTAGAGAAATITGNAASTIQTTAGIQTIQGAGGIALTSTGTNGTIVKSTTNSAISFQIQSSTSVTGLAYDTTNFHLKIYENIASPVRYADIYYDTSTGTAVFAASSGTVQLGGNTGPVTISTSGTDPVNITANGNSTWQTASGTLQIQGATSLTLDSATTGSVSLGTNANAKTVSIGNNTGASALNLLAGTGGLNIGTGLPAAAANTIQIGNATGVVNQTLNIGTNNTSGAINTVNIGTGGAGGTSSIVIGGSTGGASVTVSIQGGTQPGNSINIGTASSAVPVNIGSSSGTSKVNLQGGVLTTTNNNSGIVIGGGYSSSDTSLVPLTLDSTTTFTETASTCTATVNGGSLYYNTTSNTIRACTNGAWEDLTSTAGLGIYLFGVVSDSGNSGTIGDIAGSSGNQNSPCKVYWTSATSVTVAPCIAYSGGRKVIVPSTLISLTAGNLPVSNFANICLDGANNQPQLKTANATESSAAVPTWSAGSPVLCLATLKGSTTAGSLGGATNGIIYDIRTFTNTTKSFASINAASALGVAVVQSATAATVNNVAMPSGANVGLARGVIIARDSSNSATAVNAIIATAGPQWVKATGTSSLNSFVHIQAASGYTQTGAVTAIGYDILGVSSRTIATSCTSNTVGLTDCQQSQFLNPMVLR